MACPQLTMQVQDGLRQICPTKPHGSRISMLFENVCFIRLRYGGNDRVGRENYKEGLMKMRLIQVADSARYPRMTTEELRSTFLVDRLFVPGRIDLAYIDLDRTVVGSAVPLDRSEEHTSELQSLRHLVCRLLLEKKKQED